LEFRVLGTPELAASRDAPLAQAHAQPKRVALLTYLALARSRGGHTRDHLLALLWPELDDSHARAALRQAVHHLRHALGGQAILAGGVDELRLDPESIACDAVRFEAELDADHPEAALALYRGDLLEGFFVTGAPGFEEWLDRERARLRARAASGAWALAERRASAGDVEESASWGTRALALSHDDEMVLQRLLRLLEQFGDRVRAVLEYEAFARRVRRDYEMEPSAETRHLIDAIRSHIAAPRPAHPTAERELELEAEPIAAAHRPAPATAALARDAGVRWSHAARRATTMSLGVVGMLIAVYMIIRASGLDALGSLLASRPIGPPKTVIVAEFRTTAVSDTSLGLTLAEGVRMGLSASNATHVMTQEEIGAALGRMKRPLDSRVDFATAREIAAREGVAAIVDGEIAGVGPRYVARVWLVTADSARQQLFAKQKTVGAGELIEGVDALTRDLRRKIGESLKRVNATPALSKATTASTEALRWYTRATIIASREGNYLQSAKLFSRAVAEDSTFAQAWSWLAAMYGSTGASRAIMDSVMERAYRFRDRLPRHERLVITARYFQMGPGRDRGKAVEIQQVMFADGDSDHTNNLALLLFSRREYAAAESLWIWMRRRRQDVWTLHNLIMLQIEEGRLASAESAAARGMSELPAAGGRWRADRAFVRYAQGDLTAASAILDSLPSGLKISNDAIGLPGSFRAGIAAVQGRAASARDLHVAAVAILAHTVTPVPPLSDTIAFGILDIILGNPQRAVRRLDAALDRGLLREGAPADRPYLRVAMLYAQAGRADRARRILLLRAKELVDTSVIRQEIPDAYRVRGNIALAERRGRDAVADFWRSDSLPDGPSSACLRCTYVLLARGYDVAGQNDSTIVYLERYLRTPDSWAATSLFAPDPLYLAWAHERLGQLYEANGNSAKAVAHDRAFIELWKNADSELQPRVVEAQKRLARITSREGGK
jgi:serine/threonine-protein kinase